MITTIIAVYGAVLATASTVLGVWYFARSGPRLQAEATVDPVAIGEECDREWDDIEYILLQVWNAGRSDITVELDALVISAGNKYHVSYPFGANPDFPDYDPPDLDGPESPIRIPGHSGERWLIGGADPRRGIDKPWATATLSVWLRVGGRRLVTVPVLDGIHIGRIKHPYILKPAKGLKTQPKVPSSKVVRQQSVRKAKKKR